MEKSFARIWLYMAHPLSVPLIGLLVIKYSGTYAADLNPQFTRFIYLTVGLLTIVLPLFIISLYQFTRITGSIQITGKRERLVPYYFSLVFYISAYFLVRRLPISQVYARFLFAACIILCLLVLVSYFWKISPHLTGWGGLTGLIVSLSLGFGTNMVLFLNTSLLLSGITGFATLRLNHHTPAQVYFGFLMGFCATLVFFLL